MFSLLFTARISDAEKVIEHLEFIPCDTHIQLRFREGLERYLRGEGHVEDPDLLAALAITPESQTSAIAEPAFRANRFLKHSTGSESVPSSAWAVAVCARYQGDL